jgi:hypothetical protein
LIQNLFDLRSGIRDEKIWIRDNIPKPQHWLRTEVRYGVNIRVIWVQIASKIRKKCRNLHFEEPIIFFGEGCFYWSFEVIDKGMEFSG